jgi:hypothetical protein
VSNSIDLIRRRLNLSYLIPVETEAGTGSDDNDMNNDEKLAQLSKARNQFFWALANITVAAVCLVFATWLFFHGKLIAALFVIAVSFLAVWNADVHKNRGNAIREGIE